MIFIKCDKCGKHHVDCTVKYVKDQDMFICKGCRD